MAAGRKEEKEEEVYFESQGNGMGLCSSTERGN